MRKLLAAALTLFAIALPARSTDLNDLWWNSSEGGWGVNVAHQSDILFLTFFIYGSNNQPYWVYASATQFQGTSSLGEPVYSGPLYQSTGPWFGNPIFNPSLFASSPAGTATFTVHTANSATLTYSVSGTPVSKQVTRLTFRANPSVNGTYLGGVVSNVTGCPPPFNNGHFEDDRTLLGISGTVASTQVSLQGLGAACTISGAYSQAGRLGGVQGSITCANGVNGNVIVFEIEGNDSGVTAKFVASYSNGCVESGRFGGVRR